MLSAGSHTITSSYEGDTNLLGSDSAPVVLIVQPATPTVKPKGGTFVYDGQTHAATGTVTGVFGEDLGPPTIAYIDPHGVTSSNPPVNAGVYTVVASFAGNANYRSVTDTSAQIIITKADSTSAVTSSTSMSTFGQTVALTAMVTPQAGGTPTGTVTFLDRGTSTLGTASLTGAGTATFSTAMLSAGEHTITVSYGGDINFNGSVSTSITQTVNKANATIVVTPYHVTYNARVHTAAGTATGVFGESLAGLDLSGTAHTSAGTYTDTWTFIDATGNYNNASGMVTDQIDKANADIVVTPYHVTYNANAHTAMGSATGVVGESLAGLDLSSTTHTNAGTYTDTWTFTDATGNYNNASGMVTDQIDKANANIVVTQYHVTYNANAHTATGSATGAVGESLAGLDLTGTTHTNAGTYTDTWTFTDATGNYNNASGMVTDRIDKANANIVVTPYHVTYDANAHTATGSATGVVGESLAGLDLTGTAHTNAGTYTDTWTFTDATGNYNNASGMVTDRIDKANATISVTGYTVVYDSTAHTATGSAQGVNGESLSGLDLSGTTHTNAGNYTSDAWAFTDPTGNYTNASGAVHDQITPRQLTVTATGISRRFNGAVNANVILSDNRVAGDSITVHFASATFSDPAVGRNKTVTVTGISLSGSSAANYTLQNTTATTTADITVNNLHDVAEVFTHSEEHYIDFVSNLYVTILHRAADVPGLLGWVMPLFHLQLTDEQVESNFLISPEYVNRHGGFVLNTPSGPAPGSIWVTALYNDILGRTPSATELQGWVTELQSGFPALSVANVFVGGVEKEQQVIIAAYNTFLGRAPSQTEIVGYLNAFQAHVTPPYTIEDLRGDFVGSGEYYSRASKGNGNDSTWVTVAYQDVLGRAPSAHEVNDIWDPVLASKLFPLGMGSATNSPSGGPNGSAPAGPQTTQPVPANLLDVAQVFTHSEGHYRDFVFGLYQTYLRRAPDVPGMNGWVNGLFFNQFRDEQVTANFLSAPEYVNNHGGFVNNLPGRGWVIGLYNDVLGRTPSAAEIQGVLNALAAGQSPFAVAFGFTDSTEKQTDEIIQAFTTLLGRPPSSTEIQQDVTAFQNGLTIESLRGMLAGSSSYFFAANKGNGDDTTWVRSAYGERDILFRVPSDHEVNDIWVPILQKKQF
jgi:hypothetical protein